MDAFEMALLLDYYGGMLTEKQSECFDMRYNQDLSLGEIAQTLGVSRQAVNDNLTADAQSLGDFSQRKVLIVTHIEAFALLIGEHTAVVIVQQRHFKCVHGNLPCQGIPLDLGHYSIAPLGCQVFFLYI